MPPRLSAWRAGAGRAQHLDQALRQPRVFENRAQQHQAHPRIRVPRHGEQRVVQLRRRAENRSAPETSHRSSLSSIAPRPDTSSFWKPSGSSTRYPGWTLKKRASSSREELVRCGRAPLSSLRKVALADGFPNLLLHQPSQLLLGEFAVQARAACLPPRAGTEAFRRVSYRNL